MCGSISLACAWHVHDLSVFIDHALFESLLIVLMAMYLAGIKETMGVERFVFLLLGSPMRHMTFSLCCLIRQLRI